MMRLCSPKSVGLRGRPLAPAGRWHHLLLCLLLASQRLRPLFFLNTRLTPPPPASPTTHTPPPFSLFPLFSCSTICVLSLCLLPGDTIFSCFFPFLLCKCAFPFIQQVLGPRLTSFGSMLFRYNIDEMCRNITHCYQGAYGNISCHLSCRSSGQR